MRPGGKSAQRNLRRSAIALCCVLAAATAYGSLREVSKAGGRVRYAATSYTPLYTGSNDFQLNGPGVERATALAFPPGIASQVAIVSRAEGQLLVRADIKPTVRGKMAARLEYPQGTVADTIKVRVYGRGTVQRISMQGQRTVVGQAHRVQFVGTSLGAPAMQSDPGVYDVQRVAGDETQVAFDLTFKRCGMLWLDASKLHDAMAPAEEVRAGLASYLGDATQVIVVGPRPGETCPPVGGNVRDIKFCAPGHNWDPAHDRCERK